MGQLYLLLAIVMFVTGVGYEKFARVCGLRLVIVEIKLQFLFSGCYQLSPYTSSVTLYIICHYFAWKDNLLAGNGDKKTI